MLYGMKIGGGPEHSGHIIYGIVNPPPPPPPPPIHGNWGIGIAGMHCPAFGKVTVVIWMLATPPQMNSWTSRPMARHEPVISGEFFLERLLPDGWRRMISGTVKVLLAGRVPRSEINGSNTTFGWSSN